MRWRLISKNTGLMNLSNTFQGADITNANQTLSGIGAGFFGIDVTFSGGVLLENPLMGGTLTDPINCPNMWQCVLRIGAVAIYRRYH